MATKQRARRRRVAGGREDSVLRDFLVRELQDLYDADKQLIGAFSKFSRSANAKPVVRLCREGVSYTKERVKRLDRVFKRLGVTSSARRCDAMRGLIRDALRRARESGQAIATDLALIKSIQQMSFYGLAGYSAACSVAGALGEKESAKILRQSLAEKRSAVSEEAQILKGLLNQGR